MDHQKNSPYVEIFEGKEFIQHRLRFRFSFAFSGNLKAAEVNTL